MDEHYFRHEERHFCASSCLEETVIRLFNYHIYNSDTDVQVPSKGAVWNVLQLFLIVCLDANNRGILR